MLYSLKVYSIIDIYTFRSDDMINSLMKNDLPMYRQIADILKNRIKEGKYEYNSIIPAEKILMNEFKVSRVTIRKALETLKEKKFIQSRPGFGTFVSYSDTSYYKFTSLKSFTSEMKEIGENSKTIQSKMSTCKATKELAKIFKCQVGKKLYYMERLRGYNDEPIVLSHTYLNLDLDFPQTHSFLYGSLYHYLMSKGITFAKMREELSACLPDKETINLLQIKHNQPLLKRIRYAYNKSNKVCEYTINYYNSERYKYTINLNSVNY